MQMQRKFELGMLRLCSILSRGVLKRKKKNGEKRVSGVLRKKTHFPHRISRFLHPFARARTLFLRVEIEEKPTGIRLTEEERVMKNGMRERDVSVKWKICVEATCIQEERKKRRCASRITRDSRTQLIASP